MRPFQTAAVAAVAFASSAFGLVERQSNSTGGGSMEPVWPAPSFCICPIDLTTNRSRSEATPSGEATPAFMYVV